MKKLIFILENIRSAYNVGSIFRLANGLKADVYLCGISPLPSNPKVEKTALYSIDGVEWRSFKDIKECINYTRSRIPKVTIVAVENVKNAFVYWSINYPDVVALILGHEILGVSKEAMKLADKVVKIPMWGSKESLNVAMCAAIVGYEIVRQVVQVDDNLINR